MVADSFTLVDYIVFVAMLTFSAGIGIYFGCFGTKQKTEREYLFGKGHMKPIPVGLSLYSSAFSAVSVTGIPTEIYIFGSQYFISYFGMFFALLITWCFILPVFCGNLKITTPYEYFELRFNYKVRLLSSIIYIVYNILYMPVVLYAASISFSEITQISLPICTSIIGSVCIFYTMLGGFAAVVWSDTLQATLMFGSCIILMIKGIIDVGGVNEILNRAEKGSRLNHFNMDPNPFQRLTFWSAFVGMIAVSTAHSGCSASSLQKYMSLKSEKQARVSSFISAFSTFFLSIVLCIVGITMYANYFDCDPVKHKDISGYNKLVSHYAAHIFRNIPGIIGLFNAGILSAGLSTLSAELNTASGIIYHCCIKKIYKKSINEFTGTLTMKIIVLLLGVYYLVLAPFVDKIEHLMALVFGLNGVTYGTKIGIIVLGTTFRKCNYIGAISGAIISMIVIAWINFNALIYNVNAAYILPMTTESCTVASNISTILNTTTSNISKSKEIPFIYKLSFMYYGLLGTIITIIVGLIVSYFTKAKDSEVVDENLFIPWIRRKQETKYLEERHSMLLATN